jgi:Fe2+ or Zn2+ uptake regulation protein
MPSCRSHDADHAAMLRAAKLRVTDARIAILDVLCHASRALDAQQVLDALSFAVEKDHAHQHAGGTCDHDHAADGSPVTLDRVTVYRTLASLVDAGIAHRVTTSDRVHRYALAGAAHATHAAHAASTADTHQLTIGGVQSKGVKRTGALKAPAIITHAHPHFVCDTCGRVECLDELDMQLRPADASLAPAKADAFIKRLTAQRRIVRHEMLLHGTCADCDR